MSPRPLILMSALLFLCPEVARSQGLLVDRRPHVPIAGSFEVREVTLDGRIRDQVAEVQISQVFHNPSSQTIEGEYLFPIPDDGAIQNFVLLVDGKELPGELMDKEKARRTFEEIVRRKRDPALLEYMGIGLIKTSVFPIPPGADRKVTMRYTKLLKRDRDVVEFAYPFATQKFTAKPIQKLELSLQIESKIPIKSIYSPSHEIEKKIQDDHDASVKLTQREIVPTRDFRLLYTLGEGAIGASVLSYRPSADEDGYFLLLASPAFAREQRDNHREKTVLFVLDRSGSMAGKKIDQARDALAFVLRNLNDGDTFNIIVYDDRVESFKPELQRYNQETRDEALRYVANIRPGGSTNIDGALTTALRMIPNDDARPAYVLFLTDGLPTAGETAEMKIARNASDANKHEARIFSFGVGFDVNARLLDRLSASHGGSTEYVTPDQDIEASVARFYSRLTSPVLTRLAIEFDGTDINRAFPRDLPDLFEGGQLVWVGRYTRSGPARLTIRGRVGGDQKLFTYEADLSPPGQGSSYAFVEPLWATRRVGDIIDQIDLNGPSTELTDELVSLSRKYGILTPYTSFLALEQTDLHAEARNRALANESLVHLDQAKGATGVGQRANKATYARAEQAVSAGLDASALPLPSAAPVPGLAGGGFGGYGYVQGQDGRSMGTARPNIATGPAQAPAISLSVSGAGAPVIARDAEGRNLLVPNVRQVGKKTFFFRNNRWVDSELKPEDEAKAIPLVQFSDAYFELSRKQSAEENQYLSFTEPVTVRLGAHVYRIDPSPKSN